MALFEVEEDFHCKQSRPPLAIRGSGILNHATNVYTHKLFKLFEEEFKNAIGKFWFERSSMVVFMNLRLEEWMARGSVIVDGKNDDYEIVYRNNMMRNAYNIILKSQGNVKARKIVQDGLKKIDKAIENELAKLSISLDGQEMENEVGDGQNIEKTLDVNPILNPLVQRPKVSPMQDSKDT
ncbi:unnamed protein product [Dovyalis caffra]|uniref:Uncharacterized protein n=1 Tax=Dovyalis caffra TaxID=77055 RepID=A0AAV1RL29_9ROSI|nr:unnamed protein product [Dovyalis caffra]